MPVYAVYNEETYYIFVQSNPIIEGYYPKYIYFKNYTYTYLYVYVCKYLYMYIHYKYLLIKDMYNYYRLRFNWDVNLKALKSYQRRHNSGQYYERNC